jgi:hypothetical protein
LPEEQVRDTKEDLLDYVAATFTEVTLEEDEDKENEDARHLQISLEDSINTLIQVAEFEE